MREPILSVNVCGVDYDIAVLPDGERQCIRDSDARGWRDCDVLVDYEAHRIVIRHQRDLETLAKHINAGLADAHSEELLHHDKPGSAPTITAGMLMLRGV